MAKEREMIKIRLWGELEEVNKLAEIISGLAPQIRILNCSRNYSDRGASVYNRVYMDVELCEVKNRGECSESQSCAVVRGQNVEINKISDGA